MRRAEAIDAGAFPFIPANAFQLSTLMPRLLEHFARPATLLLSALLACGAAASSAPLVPPSAKQPPKEPETADEAVKVKVDVIGEAKAGAVVRVAVTFDIHPGWHIYWENAGESGAPTDVRVELPDGCTAPLSAGGKQQLDFPTPEIFTHGETTFGYSGRVTLSTPITLPRELPSSGLIAKLSARWLVCKGRCLMGDRQLEVDLLKGQAADSAAGKEVAASLARVPKSAPDSWSISLTEVGSESAVLVIDTHGDRAVTLVPRDRPGVVLETGFLAKGEHGSLRVKFSLSRANTLGGSMEIAGIVLVGNEPTAYSFRVPVPSSSTPAQ